MRRISAEPVFRCRSTLGEGSVWDREQSCLYWLDIYGDKVFRFDPRRRANVAYDVGANVGTVVVAQGGNLLLALRHELAWLDPETGKVSPLVAPAPPVASIRFNDGKCDPEGRFWVGTMSEQDAAGVGVLYCVDSDLSVSVKLTGLTISNGLVWHDRTFYHIDTPTQLVRRFDYDPAHATIAHPTIAADFTDDPGSPDGMCIDAEGMLWVALWGGSAVVRVDPATGTEVFRVDLPTRNVSSCAFGGDDLDELYITTARIGLSQAVLAAEPLAGSLFRVKLPFRGAPSVRFARAFG